MSNHFCISVRFLQPLAHGRKDGGEPEWPPSPLRIFQALVAASAGRWNERLLLNYAVPALAWLERQMPTVMVAPTSVTTDTPYLLYVPNNTADLLVPAWKQGEITKSTKREQKPVRSTHLADEAVHYLFPLPDDRTEFDKHRGTLADAARSVTHLGWGIDMVAADARVITQAEADKLPGHRWRVVPSGGVPLRVPKAGTLTNLMEKHAAFLGRLSADGFRPVPPLSCFDVKQYHSATAGVGKSPERPFAAFEIHRTIDDQEQPENAGKSRFKAFHQVRKVATVAGMVRHVAAEAAKKAYGWDDAAVGLHVQGHDGTKQGQATSDMRLQFLPLPSVQPVVGVGGIRRVLVVGWPGFDIAPLRRLLNGCELIEKEKGAVAMLSHVATTDKEVRKYTEPAAVWSTVTPVILPGHDDPDGLRRKLKERVTADEQKHLLERLDTRVLSLLWKAFEQAGWTADALAGAELEYRSVGWLRGLELAKSYDLPEVKFPRYHVRVKFPRAMAGPLVVGAGRYRGFGLFVRHADQKNTSG
jgi:CRISPR-associated protein Csb2